MLAFGRLDTDRLDPYGGEVVRRGGHVDLSDLAGQLEAVSDELGGRRGRELVSPLVQVHRGVQAAGLVEVTLALTGGLHEIEPSRWPGEEAKRVDVCAGDAVGL